MGCCESTGRKTNQEEKAENIRTNGELNKVGKDEWADKKFVLGKVKDDCSELQNASEELRADKDVVLVAVTSCGPGDSALQFASDNLKANQEVVLAAVMFDGSALQFAAETLRGDKKVVKAAMKQQAECENMLGFKGNKFDALTYASMKFRSDQAFVTEAVTQDGRWLQCASDDLKANKEVVKTAIVNWDPVMAHALLKATGAFGCGLAHADDSLKADREFVLFACKHDGISLAFAKDELTHDREIVEAALTQTGLAALSCPPEFKSDKELMMLATRTDQALGVQVASKELLEDRDIALATVSTNGNMLQAFPSFKDDREIAFAAAEQTEEALQFASEEMQAAWKKK